jgi:hypothetical protein
MKAAMVTPEEHTQVWHAIQGLGNKVEKIQLVCESHSDHLHRVVTEAVQAAMPSALLSDEEHQWVKLAIKRDLQSIAFRQSVIEKTTLALIWAGILTIAGMAADYFFMHWHTRS